MRTPNSALAALALLAALSLAGPAHAKLTFSISPAEVNLLSSKDTRWDTVVVKTYIYVGGDSTYFNKGSKPLLIVDIRIDTASARKHYLQPGDSLEFLNGFYVLDTLTVIKTPFVVSTWADPLWSFQAASTVEELRVSSEYVNLHPKVDTVLIAGCPPGTTALRRPISRQSSSLRRGLVATTIYDVIGRPVWSGKLRDGEIPRDLVPEGVYLMVQGSRHRTFRIVAE